jgi:hypothetical protein
MRNLSVERYLWALVLITVGAVLLADSAGFAEVELGSIFKLWPLFIIIPGISAAFRGRYILGGGLVVGGTAFLLSLFLEVNIWQFVWPTLLILFGISMIVRPRSAGSKKGKKELSQDTVDEVVIFGGVDRKITSKEFSGGKVDAVFGGGEIDISQAELAEDTVELEINCVFGGIELIVDTEKYRVESQGIGVFGGWGSSYTPSKLDKPILVVRGAAVFGGVDIVNKKG